jgi:hypothetical protein
MNRRKATSAQDPSERLVAPAPGTPRLHPRGVGELRAARLAPMARSYADPFVAQTADEVVIAFDQKKDDVGQDSVNGGEHVPILPAGTDSSRCRNPRSSAYRGCRRPRPRAARGPPPARNRSGSLGAPCEHAVNGRNHKVNRTSRRRRSHGKAVFPRITYVFGYEPRREQWSTTNISRRRTTGHTTSVSPARPRPACPAWPAARQKEKACDPSH